MIILNLTQHGATPDQLIAGVVDPTPAVRAAIVALLNFEELPTPREIYAKASALADVAKNWGETITADWPVSAMIGGAPYFMGPLAYSLGTSQINPLYAFSKRVSVEKKESDGSVSKTAVFRHVGFVVAL